MMVLWNRFRDARNSKGDKFQDTWKEIEDSKNTGAKRVSLFSWIKNRGFTDNMITETNVVVQKELLRTRSLSLHLSAFTSLSWMHPPGLQVAW